MTARDDPSARFAALYAAHYRQVYAYAVTRAGRDAAEDVASETFLVAWRRFADLPGAALPWLLGVARNVAREKYRDAARQASLAAELRAWADEAGADVADGIAERAATLAALSALSDSDRELLTLLAWHGLSARDAARVVGCSTATFFVRLHRARKRLGHALETDRHAPLPTASKEYSR
ncbi:MAG TPA: sigma-70 family RNA polymerase sigma factor [Dactylosporangium sp.]|nr:sigma-70 family RNA polymerase sigma factor [Dactylosporangium sp.]